MTKPKRTKAGDEFTEVILELIKIEGLIRQTGEELTRLFDLTPAKWKVMGPIRNQNLTVPQIARRMGMTRQAVQKTANHLVNVGLVEFTSNPDHATSKDLRLTDEGKKRIDALAEEQAKWANGRGALFRTGDLTSLLGDLKKFTSKIESD